MPDPNTLSLADLYRAFAATGLVRRALELARDEDLGNAGDLTSLVALPESARGVGAIVARAPGVISGLAALPDLLSVFGARLRLEVLVADGEQVTAGTRLATLGGSMREVLTVERTVLNLVGRLSGIATLTRRFVDAIGAGTRAAVYDTRKTTPGLRVLEKYAVRCGGGRSHRIGLYDAVLIKDNHIARAPAQDLPDIMRRASAAARRMRPDLLFVEVEVDSLEQLRHILVVEPGVVDIVLLDNMELPTLREAVAMRNRSVSRPQLEASGGVGLATVRAIAETGVERISAGALTHSAVTLDVALDILPEGA
jgi:nicotinate-nucleotide pyrophosphorylase (carboxylating)